MSSGKKTESPRWIDLSKKAPEPSVEKRRRVGSTGVLLFFLPFMLLLTQAPALAAGSQSPKGPPAVSSLATDVENSCREMVAFFKDQLRLNPHFSGALVRDPKTGLEKPGCRVSTSCPASSVDAGLPPTETLRSHLPKSGWVPLPEYDADGPGTTSFALRRGEVLCIFHGGAQAWIEHGEVHSSPNYRLEADCLEEVPPPSR